MLECVIKLYPHYIVHTNNGITCPSGIAITILLWKKASVLKNDNESGVFVVKENRIAIITKVHIFMQQAYFYAAGINDVEHAVY